MEFLRVPYSVRRGLGISVAPGYKTKGIDLGGFPLLLRLHDRPGLRTDRQTDRQTDKPNLETNIGQVSTVAVDGASDLLHAYQLYTQTRTVNNPMAVFLLMVPQAAPNVSSAQSTT